MIDTWAMIKNSIVINLIAWDGDPITLGNIDPEISLVSAPENVALGWTYVDGVWSAPA